MARADEQSCVVPFNGTVSGSLDGSEQPSCPGHEDAPQCTAATPSEPSGQHELPEGHQQSGTHGSFTVRASALLSAPLDSVAAPQEQLPAGSDSGSTPLQSFDVASLLTQPSITSAILREGSAGPRSAHPPDSPQPRRGRSRRGSMVMMPDASPSVNPTSSGSLAMMPDFSPSVNPTSSGSLAMIPDSSPPANPTRRASAVRFSLEVDGGDAARAAGGMSQTSDAVPAASTHTQPPSPSPPAHPDTSAGHGRSRRTSVVQLIRSSLDFGSSDPTRDGRGSVASAHPPASPPAQPQPPSEQPPDSRRNSFMNVIRRSIDLGSRRSSLDGPDGRLASHLPAAGHASSSMHGGSDSLHNHGSEDEDGDAEEVPRERRRSIGAAIGRMFRSRTEMGSSNDDHEEAQVAARSSYSLFPVRSRTSVEQDTSSAARSSLSLFSPVRSRANMEASNERSSKISLFGSSAFSGLRGLVSSRLSVDLSHAGHEVKQQDPEWFTSLDEFRPLEYRYFRDEFQESWYACTLHAGRHMILKKFLKDTMPTKMLRDLRRMMTFADTLKHPHLVKMHGNWESDEAMYIVEDYVVHGDLLSDSMSHPERYTESFTAQRVVAPLLRVLVYLSSRRVIHRGIQLEHLLLGAHDHLLLGHFTNAVNLNQDVASERVGLLDYMAPEMMSAASQMDPEAHRVARYENVTHTSSVPSPYSSEGQQGASKTAGLGRRRSILRVGAGATVAPAAQAAAAAKTQSSASQISDSQASLPQRPSPLPAVSVASKLLRAMTGKELELPLPRGSADDAEAQSSPPTGAIVVHNAWEWQTTYDEKVDVWQVGCMVHELLCGCLPFETPSKELTAALIMWADITEWPDALSPECIDFLQQCLTKNPHDRPSADALLNHPWIVRTCAGEALLTVAQIRQRQDDTQTTLGRVWAWTKDFFGWS